MEKWLWIQHHINTLWKGWCTLLWRYSIKLSRYLIDCPEILTLDLLINNDDSDYSDSGRWNLTCCGRFARSVSCSVVVSSELRSNTDDDLWKTVGPLFNRAGATGFKFLWQDMETMVLTVNMLGVLIDYSFPRHPQTLKLFQIHSRSWPRALAKHQAVALFLYQGK